MTDICECCGQLTSSMSLRDKSRNLTIEQQQAEIERLRKALWEIRDGDYHWLTTKVAKEALGDA